MGEHIESIRRFDGLCVYTYVAQTGAHTHVMRLCGLTLSDTRSIFSLAVLLQTYPIVGQEESQFMPDFRRYGNGERYEVKSVV